ncbi:MAG: hypothetical protein ABII09_08520 [Planctomycetota bacterium]
MRKQKDKKLSAENEQTIAFQKHIELLTGVILLVFGVYQSILYFGHTAVPNGDFPDLFKIGSDLLSFKRPVGFKQAPVLGLLQNFLYPFAWGPSRELTAGWLLNAILHPLNLLLLWLVGKKIVGKAAAWIAVIIIINPWTIYLLTEPINETTYLFFILLSFYLIFRQSRWAYLAAATASMVRYEGVALILAAFLTDIMHNKSKPQRFRALGYSVLAALPLMVWMLCTFLDWRAGSGHYLSVLFGKDYSKGFAEPTENRTGILLNIRVLWQTGFACLLTPYPGVNKDLADVLLKLSRATVLVGFLLGSIFSIIKRQWQVWMLLLFFVPYFLLHAFYPYPLGRFHSTIAWIVMLVCLFGLQSAGAFMTGKLGLPRVFAITFQIVLIIISVYWLAGLIPYLSGISALSPRSATMPYAAMAVTGLFFAGRLYVEKTRWLTKGLTILAVMFVMIISNQFALAGLLGDGKREIEFRKLGEWFAENAKPGDKMAVYNCGPAALFAGKFADNITGFPKGDNPEQLVEKLYEQNFTYVVWATREGMSKQHTGYQLMGLDKNIVFLAKPASIGPYEFVRQIGSERGFVNVFRLKIRSVEQPPEAQN